MLTTFILAALAGFVLSQSDPSSSDLPESSGSTASAGDLAALPTCAQTCLGNSTTNQGNCASEDIKCLCQNNNYIDVLSCCIVTECNALDQQTAASFNTNLCTSVNVTLPNYLGCPNGINVGSGNTSSPSSNSLASSGPAKTGSRAIQATISGSLESQLSLITTGAVATFAGGKLLTGSCSQPQFASMTLPAGGLLEFPWLGCSEEDTACCPFNIKTGGELSVCPADYTTTRGACCPIGWSIYTSAFTGETPCVTSASTPFIRPTSTGAPGASISVITNQIFTFRYALATKSAKLADGIIAGVAVGSVAGVALILTAIVLLIRQRRAKARAERDAATVSQSETNTHGRSELDPSSPHGSKGVSELPSPKSPDQPVWSLGYTNTLAGLKEAHEMPSGVKEAHDMPTMSMTAVHEMPAAPRAEMVGDTYMHEHHPAHGSGGASLSVPTGKGARRSAKEDEVSLVSPEEEASPAYTPTSGKMLGPVADEPYVGGDSKNDEEDEESGKDKVSPVEEGTV